MATNGASLTLSIRMKLREGKSADEIVRELTGRGMTEGSAQRFVDRAIAENAASADSAPA
jgi:hypothetical protein